MSHESAIPESAEPGAEQPPREALLREAEADADASQARAQAAAARAAELRSLIESEPAAPAEPARTGIRRAILSAVAGVATAALLTATGGMLWAHHNATAREQRTAEYAAAARQNVVNLMAIDYNTAADSVKRVLDGSIGKFHDNFAETSKDFVKALVS